MSALLALLGYGFAVIGLLLAVAGVTLTLPSGYRAIEPESRRAFWRAMSPYLTFGGLGLFYLGYSLI